MLIVGRHEDPAVEGRDRRPQPQWIDQHRHAARRPAAGDGKRDAGGLQCLHGRISARGQHLVLGDEGAIHIGKHQRDFRRARLRHRRTPNPAACSRPRRPGVRRSAAENVAFDGFGKAVLAVGIGHEVRRALHLRIAIAHRNAQAAALEHRDVVAAITDDRDLVFRNAQQLRKLGQCDALVGERVGEVEVVRLRAGDRRPIRQREVGVLLQPGQEIEILADRHDLGDRVERAVKILDDDRRVPDGMLLEPHIGTGRGARQPILPAKQPGLGPVGVDDLDRLPCGRRRHQMLCQRRKFRRRHHAAVEAGDRRGDLQGIDQHAQTARRAAADDRKDDVRGTQLGDRGPGALGQALVVGDQGSIDVGDDG